MYPPLPPNKQAYELRTPCPRGSPRAGAPAPPPRSWRLLLPAGFQRRPGRRELLRPLLPMPRADPLADPGVAGGRFLGLERGLVPPHAPRAEHDPRAALAPAGPLCPAPRPAGPP